MKLRIKDSVDLTVLERYGFQYDKNAMEYNKIVYDRHCNRICYEIDAATGDIKIGTDEEVWARLDDTLYDLIEDGLLEKVDD